MVENKVWEISKLMYVDTDSEMMTKIGLTIVMQNENGKVWEHYVEFHKLLHATQFMESFKPSKKWSVIQFRLDEVGVLL